MSKAAVTLLAALMVTAQTPVPVHAPDQPLKELCNPVEKRRDGMPAETILLPEEHLVCYRITSFTPSFAARNVNTNDQFGADTTRVVTLRRLCVPSSKDDGGGEDT
jgi:hypothetical protein